MCCAYAYFNSILFVLAKPDLWPCIVNMLKTKLLKQFMALLSKDLPSYQLKQNFKNFPLYSGKIISRIVCIDDSYLIFALEVGLFKFDLRILA